MIKCITCYFNISNSKNVKQNYIKFRQNFKLPITTVELAFNDQDFFIEDSIKIRGNNNNLLWQKERLLNIAISSFSNKPDAIIWIDCDILFHDETWIQKTIKQLENYPVVQLFSEVFENYNNIKNNNFGYAYLSRKINNIKKFTNNNSYINGQFGKTGLGWAIRSDVLTNNLEDTSIVGVSDLHQVILWEGAWDNHYLQIMPPKYRLHILKKGFAHYLKVQGNIGYIDSTIEHLYHGSFKNRNYYNKQKILIDHNFDPENDIAIDHNGLWKWNSDKTNLHNDIENIFYTRKEDDVF